MQWTKEQLDVLQVRGSNLLVAAAAGSGKTAVLVERIVRLVTEGSNPPGLDEILVVTFTQAAAKEMKERIRVALRKLAETGNHRAEAQLACVFEAPISTIHAFCLTLLRENFHLAGLEPGFRTGEPAECHMLLDEALEKLMDDAYADDPMDAQLSELLDCYAGYRSDQKLRVQIASLWQFSRSMPWPEEWMLSSVAAMDLQNIEDFGQTPWGKILLEEALWRVEGGIADIEKILETAEMSGFARYAETFSEDLLLLESLIKVLPAGWDIAVDAFANMSFSRIKPAEKGADPEIRVLLQDARNAVKKRLTDIPKKVLDRGTTEACSEIRAEKDRMLTLVGLVTKLNRIYARMKRRKNLVDYDDMEHMALDLLVEKVGEAVVPTPLARSMQAHWCHIMIDEYQDSNLVQETILNAVASITEDAGNLFMVGDVKQSIYRFRQARPELFLEKYARYPATTGQGRQKILLHKNFRSRKPILEAVNHLFSRIMSERLGELDYTDKEALLVGADYSPVMDTEGWPVTFCLLSDAPVEDTSVEDTSVEDISEENEQREGVDETVAGESLDNITKEAIWAAATIARLVCGNDTEAPMKVKDGTGLRPLTYADCVVLLRATNGWSQPFVENFAQLGVPLFSDTGAGFFDSLEVGLVLSLLQILDNPLQDIPYAAVLRSPIVGWSETEMATVRLDKKKDFHTCVIEHDGIYQEKCQDFLAQLTVWRNRAQLLPVGVLLEQLYDETGLERIVASLPNGQKRKADLRLLVDRALKFEKTGYRGLFQFLRYAERVRTGSGDMDSAKVIGEGEDVVRLMSVHKSKGLEYPVVLLCGTGKLFNLQDGYRRILLHHRYGFGPDRVLPKTGAVWATSAKNALATALLKETLSEEMRILYVAMTRAKERLFIFGCMASMDAFVARGLALAPDEALPPSVVFPLRSTAQWMLCAWAPYLVNGCSFLQFEKICTADVMRLRDDLLQSGVHHGTAPLTESALLNEAALAQEARRRLGWTSRYDVLRGIPSKITVTGLKHLWDEADESALPLDDVLLMQENPERLKRNGLEVLGERSNTVAMIENAGPLFGNLAHLQESLNRDIFPADSQPVYGQGSAVSGAEAALTEIPVVLPQFIQDSSTKNNSLRYGTLMHLVLQHLNPVDGSLPDIEQTIQGLFAQGLLTKEESTIPNRKALYRYVQSDLFRRMAESGKIVRETPFTVLLPAHEIIPNLPVTTNESIVVQGIADLWFEEAGRIVLVDFKTDKTMQRDAAYKRQLNWYAMALEKITGKTVKEKIIWYLQV